VGVFCNLRKGGVMPVFTVIPISQALLPRKFPAIAT
jgi:hypothetical protein